MKVLIDTPIFESIFEMAKAHSIEWSVFAKSDQVSRNTFRISDFIIPYQTNSSATTEVLTELKQEDGTVIDPTLEWRTRDKNLADPSTWRDTTWNVWIHSHNSMQAFWSGTDWEEIENMMEERTDPFLCIVVNEKREYRALLGIPALDITLDGIKIDKNEPNLSQMAEMDQTKRNDIFDHWLTLNDKREEAVKELDTRETKPAYTQTEYQYQGYSGGRQTIPSEIPKTGASYMDELKKDQRTITAQTANLDYEGDYFIPGWFICDKNLELVGTGTILSNAFSEQKRIIAAGNVICWLDTWGTPIGIYNGYDRKAFEKKIPFSSFFPGKSLNQNVV